MRSFCYILSALAVVGLTSACASKKKAELKEGEPTVEAPKGGEAVASKDASIGQDKTYQCEVLNDTRLITLDRSENRCEVHYTKFGDKSQVAWAEATPSICSDVFSKIRENIEGRGFKCVSSSGVGQDTKTASVNEEPKALPEAKKEVPEVKAETQTASKE